MNLQGLFDPQENELDLIRVVPSFSVCLRIRNSDGYQVEFEADGEQMRQLAAYFAEAAERFEHAKERLTTSREDCQG